jgi:hypothetical protein
LADFRRDSTARSTACVIIETTVAPLPPGPLIHLIGQAALYDNGTFWTAYISGEFDPGARLVVGINVGTREVAYTLNASSWQAPTPLHVVVDIFANPHSFGGGGLIVTARLSHSEDLYFYEVADPRGAGTARLLGSLDCTYCADMAWDPTGELLYALYNAEASDDATGSLVVISTANASAPTVIANVSLQGHFSFPQWDGATRSVIGLTLVEGGPAGFTRNVTLLSDPATGAYNATSHGAIGGGFYVDLEDGPSAFDPVTRRAFYMLATGPLAAFDVVTVDVDTAAVIESPSICGFIGYCPDSFAYGPGV